MSLLKKILSIICNLYTNIQGCRVLLKIPYITLDNGYCITALHRCEFRQMKKDYYKAFDSKLLKSIELVCYIFCEKLCFVLRDENDKILAYMFFIFNKHEWIQGYIHSNLIFVADDFQNTGVGALLEGNVLKFLQNNTSLRGIMARVTIQNKNAYRLIKYNGFEVMEEYTEANTGKKRVYVVKKFV